MKYAAIRVGGRQKPDRFLNGQTVLSRFVLETVCTLIRNFLMIIWTGAQNIKFQSDTEESIHASKGSRLSKGIKERCLWEKI